MSNDPEEFMAPIPEEPDRQISERKLESLLSHAINLGQDNSLVEPTCPICTSSLRAKAEETFKKSRKADEVTILFKPRLGVNKDVVDNHMNNHMDKGGSEIRKIEYVEKITRLSNKNATTLERLDMCLSVLTDRLMQINSLSPTPSQTLSDIEKLKNSETVKIMSSYSSMLKLQATLLGEMRDTGEIISIPRETFVQVFNTAITSAKSDREREIVKSILNGLKGG